MIQLKDETKTVVDQNKITDMVTKMLILGDVLSVDSNKQVHYVNKEDEPILIPTADGESSKPLYTYGIDIKDPDAIILNPLAEGATAGKERLFFYHSLSHIAVQWLLQVIILYISECVASQKSEGISDPELMGKLAPFSTQIDEKMIAEIETIRTNGIEDFGNIYYNRKTKTTTLMLGFEDDTNTYHKSFPKSKIRKKSWELFLDIAKHILGVPKEQRIKDVYTSTTDKVESPQFETFTTVWIKLWKSLSPFMKYFEGHDDPGYLIEALEEHFKFVPVYRLGVSWLRNPTSVSTASKFTAPNSGITTAQQPQQQAEQIPIWKRVIAGTAFPNMVTVMSTNQTQLKPWQSQYSGMVTRIQRRW